MKLSCEIIRDLLPLYEDGICSKESKAVVEEHLKECASCRTQFQNVQKFEEPQVSAQTEEENRAVVKSFRKIRRRWAVSLAVMLLIMPILVLTVNQVRQEGICYTNIDEIMIAGGYMRDLKNQDWEGASARIDYEKMYNDIQILLGMTVEDFLPSFTSVMIGKDEWMVNEVRADEWPYQYVLQFVEDEDLFWENAVFGHCFVIPIDNWEKLRAEKPKLFRGHGVEEIVMDPEDQDELCYKRMETKWGTFMVPWSSGMWADESIRDFCSAKDFCYSFGMAPAEVYREAEADIMEEAQKQYDYIQEYYGAAIDMPLEDFCGAQKVTYIQGLAECVQNGFVFGDSKYTESRRVTYNDGKKEGWDVTYSIDVTYQGKSYTVQISFLVSDGKITGISGSWPMDFAEGEMMYNALAVCYR